MTFSKDQAIFFSDSPSSLRASLFLSSCELTVHLHHWRTEWREQGSLMSCLGVKLPPSLDSCALLSLWDLNTPARDQMHAWNCRALTTGSGEGNRTHSSTLAWEIPWVEEPGGLQSMGSLRVGHDWATSLSLFTFVHWRRKWQPTPAFLPGESQGRRSLVGCRLWGRTESDTTEAT